MGRNVRTNSLYIAVREPTILRGARAARTARATRAAPHIYLKVSYGFSIRTATLRGTEISSTATHVLLILVPQLACE